MSRPNPRVREAFVEVVEACYCQRPRGTETLVSSATKAGPTWIVRLRRRGLEEALSQVEPDGSSVADNMACS